MNSSTKLLAASAFTVALLVCACEKVPESASNPTPPPPSAPGQSRAEGGAVALANPARNPADWPQDAIWYQIFPERFRNGDPSNDPTRDSLEWPVTPSAKWRISPWTGDWHARDEWEKEIGPDFFTDGVLDRRYGGDLQGVLDKLDYLVSLGVNAIYFNPLFYSRSLHKYDGNSYHHIDPYFGPDPRGDLSLMDQEIGGDPKTWKWTAADKLFLRVLSEAHRRGMRVILDGVFNHTGRDFFAFKDLLKNQAASRYRDWYVVSSFDDPNTKRDEFDYKGWWGHKTLPVFAASADGTDMAPGPKDYIFAATKRWMDPKGNGDVSTGIDGWRLDVAPERPAKFWADWNAYVRQLNPNAYTSCEVWSDSSKLIADGKFSACMNYYAFSMPVKGFLIDARITASQFARLLDVRRNALPKPAVLVMQNLMDSHDTDRLASSIVNSDLATYTDPEKIEFNSNADVHASASYKIRKPNARERNIQRLVVLFQMTYAGAPMIYYGSEAGMWGATDPEDRMPMVWPEMKFAPQAIDPRGRVSQPDEVAFDDALFQFYRSAINLRRAHGTLRHGEFRVVETSDSARTFAFQRRDESESLIVVFNRDEQLRSVRINLPGTEAPKARAIFFTGGAPDGIGIDPTPGRLTVRMPPLSGAVIAQ